MIKFGLCVPVEESARAKAAGYDFVEEVVQRLLQGEIPDPQWDGAQRAAASRLPLPAANALVPASLKITGPDVSPDRLRAYTERVVNRAADVGIKLLVFGSGAARTVPDGFDRQTARRQILDFVRMAVPYCAARGVVMVCEPLNRGECNIINSVAEAMEYVWQVDHPNFQCLVDSFHFWLEDEPLGNLRDAMPWIRHVHVADPIGRTPPGVSGKQDYRPFFAELKRGGYEGLVTVEAIGYARILEDAGPALEFMTRQWNEA